MASAAATPAEKRLLEKLKKEDGRHGPFPSLAAIQSDRLNATQINALLVHFGVTAADCPTSLEERRAEVQRRLPKNAVTEAERALKLASAEARQRAGSYADQYGHLSRVVNQLFGSQARPIPILLCPFDLACGLDPCAPF